MSNCRRNISQECLQMLYTSSANGGHNKVPSNIDRFAVNMIHDVWTLVIK